MNCNLSNSIWKLKHHFRQALLFLLVNELLHSLVESGGDLGSIECVNGKWQVDTKIISLIVVCPIQLSWDSLMCVFRRLGLYENDVIHEDFHIFLCSLFTGDLVMYCINAMNRCMSAFGGIYALQFMLLPVGLCLWNNVHDKVNCTV